MKAMIFAAGLGTRLKPITDTLPKALVPINGRPLLDHVITTLTAAGIDGAVVNVHHFADKIREHIDTRAYGIPIEISDETDLLRETGGGIRHARKYLEGHDFLAHNVDIISNLDIKAFIASIRPDALSTVIVSERDTSRYLLFNDDMRLVGWTNISTGEIKSPHRGLDPGKCHKLAFSGIHLMSRHIFNAFDNENVPERFPIIDFYVSICDRYPIYGYCPAGLKMIDVGKIETLDQAERLCKEIGF